MASADRALDDAFLALRDATVRFGAVVAVRDASIDVRRGDAIAVVGANGSGKTTLLRLLHGVVAHSGTRRVGTAAASQAMVFQRPFLLRLSVRHNLRIALWLAARGLSARERAARADEALARVGLQALADRPARALSGGEQQRLALARSWSVRPSILFLDEPTANLDPSAKKEVESLLAGFIAEGMTIVMSTHNLGQAKRLATRIVYMDGGRIGADLATAQFFAEQLGGRADLFLKGDLSWSLD
ncbi:MAG TPA: ATP-binding cassette domain-containing protein [Caldimonas sp.]|jgi:tungstate transport system ATP-binding protein|nr:ATP-binding cassette domain-containing protein [Caldimonas sp.]HEV7577690.1 ATP-binding cassette domain-containing protein [Caldimonas sp.]